MIDFKPSFLLSFLIVCALGGCTPEHSLTLDFEGSSWGTHISGEAGQFVEVTDTTISLAMAARERPLDHATDDVKNAELTLQFDTQLGSGQYPIALEINDQDLSEIPGGAAGGPPYFQPLEGHTSEITVVLPRVRCFCDETTTVQTLTVTGTMTLDRTGGGMEISLELDLQGELPNGGDGIGHGTMSAQTFIDAEDLARSSE